MHPSSFWAGMITLKSFRRETGPPLFKVEFVILSKTALLSPALSSLGGMRGRRPVLVSHFVATFVAGVGDGFSGDNQKLPSEHPPEKRHGQVSPDGPKRVAPGVHDRKREESLDHLLEFKAG